VSDILRVFNFICRIDKETRVCWGNNVMKTSPLICKEHNCQVRVKDVTAKEFFCKKGKHTVKLQEEGGGEGEESHAYEVVEL
jgi:hypothetical protein